MTSTKSRLTAESERVNPVTPIHLWKSPAGAAIELLVLTHLPVYTAIYEHSVQALPNETGGFLLGRVAWDARAGAWVVEVEDVIPVEPIAQNPVHFTFGWRDVDRVRSLREAQGKALVGWYHTHPGMEIFLSDTDMDKTHRVLFSEPFQIALVYDPVRGRAGYFFWEGPQVLDAGTAPWREFEIALDQPQPRDETPAPSPMAVLAARFQQAAAEGAASVPPAAVADAGIAAGRQRPAVALAPTADPPAESAESVTALAESVVRLDEDRGPAPAESVSAVPAPAVRRDKVFGFGTGLLAGVLASLLLAVAYFLLRHWNAL